MKKLLLLALIIAVAGGGFGYYMWNKAPEGVARKRPEFTVTPAALLADFENNEEVANAKYLGKVVQVKGKILEIIPGEDMVMQVILDTGDLMSRVSCTMEEEHSKFLARNLKKDDMVSIKGFCTGKLDDIIMERCVIEG